jgi:uncharacterized protein
MNLARPSIGPPLAALCRRHHVRVLSVFGSAARGTARPDSDIDLLVEFLPGRAPSLAGLARLKHEFAQALGVASVDLATPSILRNPYRRQSILSDLKQIYAA